MIAFLLTVKEYLNCCSELMFSPDGLWFEEYHTIKKRERKVELARN